MTDASLRYEIDQLKRKLLQTQEERDRAMSNCHELWKRLNSLISLAASTTASYALSSSGLPTSPSDSYDSRSKSTSPNSSSAASLNGSLLSTTNGNGNNNNNSSNNSNNNNQSNNNQQVGKANLNNNNSINNINNSNHQTTQPLNLKSSVNSNNTSNHTNVYKNATSLHHYQLSHQQNNNNNNSTHNNNNNNNSSNNHSPLNLKSSVNAIKDINNNHPLIAEVAKVTTVGEIEEIAPGQFKCRYCDKTFDRIFSVHRHERVHTGFKPCVCKACGRGFSEKRNLRHHIIRFHSDGSGRELLKRNRNKTAAAAAAAAAAASAISSAQHHNNSNLNSHANQQSPPSATSMNNNNNNNSNHINMNHNSPSSQQHQQHQHQLSSTTSSQIIATINRLQNINKSEPHIDTTGLNVLGAAAAVITVSSSSSRRRKSKPSKKINF